MSLEIGYYPGCSALGTSMEYDLSTRGVCKKLGIGLKDIPDWTCCGSTPAHTVDHVLSTALAARNFAQAETVGIEGVVTTCPSCLKNLRNALDHMEDSAFKQQVDALTQRPLQKEHTIKSVLQILVEDIGLEVIKEQVKRPLTGLKVVPYYGCLMNRPASTMKFDDPENPMAMDNLLTALGATVLPFPLKVECCGASFGIPERQAVPRLGGKLLGLASSLGAEAIVVACPLCQMNLDLRQGQINRANGTNYSIAVPYFTQLLGFALGLDLDDLGFSKLNEEILPLLESLPTRKPEPSAKKTTPRKEQTAGGHA